MADQEGVPTQSHALGSTGDTLLSAVSASDRIFLEASGVRSKFARGAVLVTANVSTDTAYFIERGIASVVKPDRGDRRTEVCLVGPEGFAGTAIIQGDTRCPYETFVQSDEVHALCVGAAAVCSLFDRSKTFRTVILNALHVQAVQIAENLVCAAWQPIKARLARWLLMYQDRAGTAYLEVTHEFMAIMIGAQRTKVTVALHELEAMGAIAATRGRVRVKDRLILQRLAGGTYGCAEAEAKRLLPGAGEATERSAEHPG